MLVVDAFIAIFREFGWEFTGVVVIVSGLVVAVRVLATRLEKAYAAQIQALKDGHEQTIKALNDGHQREVQRIQAHSDRGWEMQAAFQSQAERLAERYRDATELSRDMADEVLEKRRTRGTR